MHTSIALYIIQFALGVFFTISGYHKLTNPARHAAMRQTLVNDHIPFIRFNEWWVPSWELIGGIMVGLNILAPLFAFVLAVICAVACVVDAPARVREYQPIDKADCLDDWLYLPEVLYVLMLLPIIARAFD